MVLSFGSSNQTHLLSLSRNPLRAFLSLPPLSAAFSSGNDIGVSLERRMEGCLKGGRLGGGQVKRSERATGARKRDVKK